MRQTKTLLKDGATMIRTVEAGHTRVEFEEIEVVKVKGKNMKEYLNTFSERPTPTITRAQRMRGMIDSKEYTREQIKTTLITESYDVKTFASEWFRLNK